MPEIVTERTTTATQFTANTVNQTWYATRKDYDAGDIIGMGATELDAIEMLITSEIEARE